MTTKFPLPHPVERDKIKIFPAVIESTKMQQTRTGGQKLQFKKNCKLPQNTIEL